MKLEADKSRVAGIDLHRKNAFVVVYDRTVGSIVSKKKVESSTGGEQLFQSISCSLISIDDISVVVVEPGPTSRLLIQHLERNGFDARLVDARTASRYRQGLSTNDWHDAENLARAYSADLVKEVYCPNNADYNTRKMVRVLSTLTRDLVRTQRRLQDHMLEHTGTHFGILSLYFLTNKKLQQLLGLTHAYRTAVELRSHFFWLIRRKVQFRQAVVGAVKQHKLFKELMSIPGVGKVLAAIILMESGNVKRFRNADQYAAYCGIASGCSTSDGRVKRINRTPGNRFLKNAFSLAARNIARDRSRSAQVAIEFLERKLDKDDAELKATQALALRLCKSAFVILRDETKFDAYLCFGIHPQQDNR